MAQRFSSSDIDELDCSRTARPNGWDPLGLSVWDTGAGGLQDPKKVLGPRNVDVSAELGLVWALNGPPLDRCAIYLAGRDPAAVDPQSTPDPLVPILFRIVVGSQGVTGTTVEGSLLASPAAPRTGPVLQLSGRLCTRWEFWARIDPNEQGAAVQRLRFRCLLDRVGNAHTLDAGIAEPLVIPFAPICTLTLVQ